VRSAVLVAAHHVGEQSRECFEEVFGIEAYEPGDLEEAGIHLPAAAGVWPWHADDEPLEVGQRFAFSELVDRPGVDSRIDRSGDQRQGAGLGGVVVLGHQRRRRQHGSRRRLAERTSTRDIRGGATLGGVVVFMTRGRPHFIARPPDRGPC
jgi:hypothetical protein